jgi:hypothetical protein
MRIERDNVTISYSDWNGRTIQYRGKVDPAGKINARDTNDDGSGSILAGQIGNNGSKAVIDTGPGQALRHNPWL